MKKSTATTSFSEQYKHPNWQKKRLEILERDQFTCQRCGDTESTLHVHHTYYGSNLKLWEYGDRGLITLCEECHEKVHGISQSIKHMVTELLNKYRDGDDIDRLYIAHKAFVIACLDVDGDYIKRISDCWDDFKHVVDEKFKEAE